MADCIHWVVCVAVSYSHKEFMSYTYLSRFQQRCDIFIYRRFRVSFLKIMSVKNERHAVSLVL